MNKNNLANEIKSAAEFQLEIISVFFAAYTLIRSIVS